MSAREAPEDRLMACKECGQNFVWTAGEQEFYREKGLTEPPKRCKQCRQAKRAERGEQQRGGNR